MKHGDFGDFDGAVWGLTPFPSQPQEAIGGPAESGITASPLSLSNKGKMPKQKKKSFKKEFANTFLECFRSLSCPHDYYFSQRAANPTISNVL